MKSVQTSFIDTVTPNRAGLADQFLVACISYQNWSKEECEAKLCKLPSAIYRRLQPLALLQDFKDKKYWVLLKKDNALEFTADDLSFRYQCLSDAPEWVFQGLLVRAVPRLLQATEQESKRIEADGIFYIIKQKPLKPWGYELVTATVEPRKIKVASVRAKVPSMWRLNLGTVTFTPLKAHEDEKGELYAAVAKLPRYDADQFGQDVTRREQGQYVKRARSKFKNRVAAFKFNNPLSLADYYSTRLGTLSLFLEDLNRAYGDDFKIKLKSIEFDEHKHIRALEVARSYVQLHNLVQQFPIYIVNHSRDLEAAERLRVQLLILGIEPVLAADISPERLNIQLVSDKGSYKKGEADPYKVARAQYPQAVIQSCYPERLDATGHARHTVEVVVKELLIKLEVQQCRLIYDYPVLPEDAWFMTQVQLDIKGESWCVVYCKVQNQRLEFGVVPEQVVEDIHISLNSEQRKRFFTGKNRPNLVFWPQTGSFLLLSDTEAVCLPDEAELHSLIKEVEQTVASGIPTELVADYCTLFPDSAVIARLSEINLMASDNIAVSALKAINYQGKDNQHFYDYLAEHGYRLKTSLQKKDNGLLSVTAGVLIDRANALYAAGSVGGAQRGQENFNHIYHVETDLDQVPEWFWDALDVWHVRHRGATVYPYVFKHLREYGDRQVLQLGA